MKKIMFGNSLMLLGIAIMILAGLELIYIGIMWASFLLIPVGFYKKSCTKNRTQFLSVRTASHISPMSQFK